MTNALTDLATRINAAHNGVASAFKSVVERAIEAGELLWQAKGMVPHGQWLPWLSEHCPTISERTAQRYMQLAEHRAALEAKAPCLADLTLTAACNLVAPPDYFPETDDVGPDPEDEPAEHKAPGPVKGRRVPRTLDEAWERAKPSARREFVKYHAEGITEILDALRDEPLDDPIEEALAMDNVIALRTPG